MAPLQGLMDQPTWLSRATWHIPHTRLQRLWDAQVDIGHADQSPSMRPDVRLRGAELASSVHKDHTFKRPVVPEPLGADPF